MGGSTGYNGGGPPWEKRFEQVDKRFEQVDKRFEELREDMKTQFNRVYGFLTGLFLAVGGGFITLVVRG
jgi:hypothetical protein